MITPSFYKTLTRGTGSLFQVYSRGWKKKQTHGKATATSPEQRDFPAVHWPDSPVPPRWFEAEMKWQERYRSDCNPAVGEVSGAQGKGCAAFPAPGCPRSPPGEGGSPNTSFYCCAPALPGDCRVSALRLGALPTPHVFPLQPWVQNNTERLRNSPAGSALPGGDRAAGWQRWNQRPSSAALRGSESRTFRVVEHHLLVPWTRADTSTSSKQDRSSLTPPTAHLAIFPSNFLLFSQQRWNVRPWHGFSGWLGLLKMFLHWSMPVWMQLHCNLKFIPSAKSPSLED